MVRQSKLTVPLAHRVALAVGRHLRKTFLGDGDLCTTLVTVSGKHRKSINELITLTAFFHA